MDKPQIHTSVLADRQLNHQDKPWRQLGTRMTQLIHQPLQTSAVDCLQLYPQLLHNQDYSQNSSVAVVQRQRYYYVQVHSPGLALLKQQIFQHDNRPRSEENTSEL